MQTYYKLSELEYICLLDCLKKTDNQDAIKLLEKVQIVSSDERKKKKSINHKKLEKKEFLTNSKMHKLFGNNYKGLIFYNFDEEKWNIKDNKNSKLRNKTYDINLLKRSLESAINKIDYELVAFVTMPVADANYIGWGKILQNIKYDPKGHVLVGTLVWRDKMSGKIVPVSSNWQQGEFFLCERNSKEDAINRYVQDIIRYENFKKGIFADHGRV